MTQGSSEMAGTDRIDARAVRGLLRAVEGAMPDCPAELAIRSRDGLEKRFRGVLHRVTPQGLVFRASGPHHLPEIWPGDTLTVGVGTGLYRFHGRIRPEVGTDIVVDWTPEDPRGHLRAHVHPAGHEPVRPEPLTLVERPSATSGPVAAVYGPQATPESALEPKSRSSKVYRWLQSLGYTFIR